MQYGEKMVPDFLIQLLFAVSLYILFKFLILNIFFNQ